MGGFIMTIAEIHGKLPPYEQMEDLLTSDVFSTFKYLGVNNGLIQFLKKPQALRTMNHLIFLRILWKRVIYFGQSRPT